MTSVGPTAAAPVRSKEIDWSGQWFQLLHEQGEDVLIRVGVRTGGDARAPEDEEEEVRSHVDFDGLGAVVDVLAGRGVNVEVGDGNVPAVSAVTATVTALRFAADVPKHVDWWPRHPLAETPAPPPATATKTLSVDETRALVARARAAGGTVTTLLLSRLAQTVAPTLTTPSHAQPWMVPVNLRGRVSGPLPRSNTVGFLTLTQNSTSTAASTKAALQAALQAGEAQATWQLNQIGKIVGKRGMQQILRKATSRGYKNVGNFSNLGVLNATKLGDVHSVTFLPPVARSQSCAVGVVTVAGRLSISCVLHPTVRVSRDVMKAWLDDVVRPEP